MTKESRWNYLFIGIWILAFYCASVKGECERITPELYTIKETDPAGTDILTLSATGGVTWSYVFSDTKYQQLKEYLSFTKIGDTYNLSLAKPLDLEEIRDNFKIDESGFSLTFACSEPLQADEEYYILLICQAVNEFPPEFNTSSINVYVQETISPVTVVQLVDWASDRDQNPITTEINGFSFLEPTNALLGIQTVRGRVFNRAPLDYESLPEDKKYIDVGVRVRDTGGRTSTASLTIHVLNVDDLPPRFTYSGCPDPCSSVYYSAAFSANVTGKLSGIKPSGIQAVDGDDLGSSITYSIIQGPNGYADYISMNPTTAEVTILKPLHGLESTDLVLIFRAQENTDARRSTSTSLLISVQGGAGPIIPLASASTDKDNIVIVGVVLGITVFIILIILIVAMIYYRKRFRKMVHPHNVPKEEQSVSEKGKHEEASTPQVHTRPIILSDEEMKVDEEITTWLPANHLSDIVDLSDEDTLKMKKKNGVAPNSTTMTSRDSAFEESSDKKSGSGDSQRDADPDFDPVTEYAEVGMPNECSHDSHVKSSDHVYVPDPTTDQKGSMDTHNINDSGVDEAEYLTPNSTRVKLQNQGVAYNKGHRASGTNPDTSIYSDLISIDDDRINNIRQDSQVGDGISSGAAAHVKNLERGNNFASSSPKPKSHRMKKSDKALNSHQYLSDDTEITEYSTPRSEKANRGMTNSTRRFNDEDVLSPNLSAVNDDDDDRPEVPPRPKIRQLSGLKVKDSDKTNSNEVHYASVQKKSSRKHKKESSERDEAPSGQNNADNDSKDGNGDKIDPPMRRKRHRKRSKHVKAPEEDVYDGTKDYEDLEMDPEFYLDTNKTRIKRSSRVRATHIDPDDTQYWITVTNDY